MPVFISYSHSDSDFAIELASQLVVHKARVWIDKWELNVGDSLIDRIQDAITGASALLVILSKASVESEWCKRELNAGLIRELAEKRVLVLPVLKEDCPIPLFLQEKKYADFRKDYDQGLSDILDAVGRVTSDTLGRYEEPTWHMDWAVSWGRLQTDRNESPYAIEITIVEQAQNQPYSSLTTINMVGNKQATKRYLKFLEIGLDWYETFVLVKAFSDMPIFGDFRLLLKDENPVWHNIFMSDAKTKGNFSVRVTSRRLGQDTGKNILLDVGNQIQRVAKLQQESIRPLLPSELIKIQQIQKNFG